MMDSAQGSDLAPMFEVLSQIEKNSEIKPPLTVGEKDSVSVTSRD